MANLRITKRGNVYQYQFEIARVKGKRKYINKSGFKTKNEAIEAGNIAYTEYFNAGKPFKESKLSYSDYLDYWLNNYCKSNLKYNTIEAYKVIIEKYIKPKLGKYKISSITSVALNNYISKIVNEYDFSREYFKNILKVVKGSFRDACNLYGIIKYYPALTIRLPKIEKMNDNIKHLYTEEEINIILKRFRNNPTFICAFLVSLFTGMRTGEVFALTWDDIDLDNNIIYVNHNVYDKPKDKLGRWYLGTTKTTNGKRKIYIGEILKKTLINYKNMQDKLKKLYGKDYKYYHLEEFKNEYGKVVETRIVLNKSGLKYQNINLVFTQDNGNYVGTDLIRYPFRIIHTQLGINKCRFYDLRGSYATKILNNGTEIRDVADILGHKKIETTENYYIRSTDNSKKNAVNLYEKNINLEVINEVINFKL